MQTGIKMFDFSPQMPSIDGRKNVPAATKQGGEPSPEQLHGFMEIMGALMSLPPDQWEESLAGLEALSIDGDSAPIDSLIDIDPQAAAASEPSDLLQLFFKLNGGMQPEPQQDEVQEKGHLLLNMAKAMFNDQRPFAPDSDDGDFEDWKSRWQQMDDPNFIKVQADEAGHGDAAPVSSADPSVSNEILGIDSIPVEDKAEGQRKLQRLVDQELDPGPDSEDNALLDAAPPEKTAKELSPKLSQARPASYQLAGSPEKETKNENSGAEKQQISAENSKPPVVEKPVAVDRQFISDTNAPDSETDTLSLANAENPEDHALQKPSAPSGGHQGLLSRIEPRHNQGVVQVTGAQEAMVQDKEIQSDVIRQIVQRMSMHTQGAQSKMVIRLKPEFLGDVHMQVLTENHQVTVRMMTDSFMVKEIVEQNLQHLRSELQHHGLEIQKFDVFVANDNDGWKHGQDQAGFKETLQQRQQRPGGGKARRQGAKTISRVVNRRPLSPRDLNEIDYFA